MGVNLSWVAVQGADAVEVLGGLGLEPYGDASSEVGETYAYASLEGGWLVLSTRSGERTYRKLLADISRGRDVLAGEIYETAMVSSLAACRDGIKMWSILRDPEKSDGGFQLEGVVPAGFASIRKRLEGDESENDEADYLFDAPIELAEQLCGYRPGAMDVDWILLRKSRSRSNGAPERLRPAIDQDLVPLVMSLGWDRGKGRSDFQRMADGVRHQLSFSFTAGQEIAIVAEYAACLEEDQSSRLLLAGNLRTRFFEPAWRRVWRRLTGAGPGRGEQIAMVVQNAGDLVRTIDDLLRTGARRDELPVWGPAAKTWPDWRAAS